MDDDLTISGGGSVAVATDALLGQADALARLGRALRSARGTVIGMAARLTEGELVRADSPVSAVLARRELEHAAAALGLADGATLALATELRVAIDAYGVVEKAAQQFVHSLGAGVAWGVGTLLPVLLPGAALVVGAVTAGAFLQSRANGEDIGQWIDEHNALMTNPGFVGAVRELVMGIGPFEAGLFHLPPQLAGQLGSGRGPLSFMGSSTSIVAALAALGISSETRIAVSRTNVREGVRPPTTFADRAGRIMHPEDIAGGGDQVRIDRYTMADGSTRFDVYIAGTVDFGLKTGEPFDMTSNLVGEAGLPAGSYLAAREAMQRAGVTSKTPVTLNGYSQGGLVASMLAASGDYSVAGLVTFGSPSGQVPIAANIPVLSVRHTDDIVPALGGYDTNPQALVVERQAFAHAPVPTNLPAPAHQFFTYQHTADMVDSAQSDAVRSAVKRLADFGAGSLSVESTTWRALRVDAAGTPIGVGPGAGGSVGAATSSAR